MKLRMHLGTVIVGNVSRGYIGRRCIWWALYVGGMRTLHEYGVTIVLDLLLRPMKNMDGLGLKSRHVIL